jgi:hypothetical protein
MERERVLHLDGAGKLLHKDAPGPEDEADRTALLPVELGTHVQILVPVGIILSDHQLPRFSFINNPDGAYLSGR